MLRLKKMVLAVVSILTITLSIGYFRSDAQTGRSAGKKGEARLVGLAPRPGVDYSKFSHTTHSLECSDCHEVKDGEIAYKFPKHDSCNECHNFVPFRLSASGFCMICHDNKNNYKSVRPGYAEKAQSDFGTKFPHAVHIGANGTDFDKNNKDPLDGFDEKLKKVQAVSKESGCIECHVKDGPDKKEQSFSNPNHPECFRCHGSDPNTKVAPVMQDCTGCHKPWLAKQNSVSGLFPTFYHDDTHEDDSRPKPKTKTPEEREAILKERAKDLTKNKKLKCQYCHDVNKAERLVAIDRPLQSRCTVCHDKRATARALTDEELDKLKADPAK